MLGRTTLYLVLLLALTTGLSAVERVQIVPDPGAPGTYTAANTAAFKVSSGSTGTATRAIDNPHEIKALQLVWTQSNKPYNVKVEFLGTLQQGTASPTYSKLGDPALTAPHVNEVTLSGTTATAVSTIVAVSPTFCFSGKIKVTDTGASTPTFSAIDGIR